MFYIVITETGAKCGPLETHEEAHLTGTTHYGTGNFTIEEEAKAPKAPKVPKE